jgi:hypothetical protein
MKKVAGKVIIVFAAVGELMASGWQLFEAPAGE